MATINIRLMKNFTTQYNKMQTEYGEEFARLNGFADEQLSFTDFIDNFIDAQTVADASVDGNANVGTKDMRTLMNEMPKSHRKLLSFNKIYYELNKKYGFKIANDWLRAEWTKALYMHDADTATYIHYCFAYDLKDVAEKGLFFLSNFNAEPPQHLSTFVDFVKEFISFAANRSSGAVGLPNLIPYMYYFWKKDCKNGYATKSDDYYARQQIQRFIYAVNQPYVRDGMQSAFTNVSVFDGPYLEALFGGSEFPDGTFMIDELDKIKEFQKTFMEVVADIRQHNMFTFPVLTISLLRQDHKFIDEEFARWGIAHNMKWNDSNLFIDDSVTSLSNCCRLKSNIEDLGYFNSIGGTALKVGSVKVSTVNLARLALEHDNEQDYLVALRDLVELDCKVLDVVRHIIQRNVEKGLLPNFSKGLVDFEHLYNTVGILGIYETMKSFGYTRVDEFGNTFYTEKADKFGKKIFEVIHRTKDQFALDKDYKINLEQIPGETAAVKMQKADQLLYPETVVDDLPLYGNQFIPLGIKTTLQERIRIASLFDSYCNGGSIAHINIDAPFDSFEKAWKMTEYIADQGLTYFAFNTKIQTCKHNHAFYGKTCPVCGEPVATEYTRIVGFYTPIKTWSKERKQEYTMREWENINED
jgi:ribonucleoside-triphosphate reductase